MCAAFKTFLLLLSWPIGGFGGGTEGAAPPFFSCIFKTFLYDPNPSNRFSSVVITIQSGWSFHSRAEWGTRPLLSEFSGSAPVTNLLIIHLKKLLDSVWLKKEYSFHATPGQILNASANYNGDTRGSYGDTQGPPKIARAISKVVEVHPRPSENGWT